jgi:predicted Zn-dependent protease
LLVFDILQLHIEWLQTTRIIEQIDCCKGLKMNKTIVTLLLAALLPLHTTAQQAQQTPQADGLTGIGKMSRTRNLVPAEQVESAGAQQYRQMIAQAQQKGLLAPDNHPEVLRLRAIAKKIIPQSTKWNPRAAQWQWEVNLLMSGEVNAFCMPGGKIAFYAGILDKLKLTDEEVAAIMGHEVAHALREHGRERVGKQLATQGALSIGSALLGLGDLGRMGASMGAQLISLRWGREDETEADLVGMDVAARAGYDPRAGVTLWQKMAKVNAGNAPPQWLSTHPSGNNRIAEISKRLPQVMPVFASTQGKTVAQLAPYQTNMAEIAPVK